MNNFEGEKISAEHTHSSFLLFFSFIVKRWETRLLGGLKGGEGNCIIKHHHLVNLRVAN